MSDYPRYGLFQFLPDTFAEVGESARKATEAFAKCGKIAQMARDRQNLQGQAISALVRGDHKAHRRALDALRLLDRE